MFVAEASDGMVSGSGVETVLCPLFMFYIWFRLDQITAAVSRVRNGLNAVKIFASSLKCHTGLNKVRQSGLIAVFGECLWLRATVSTGITGSVDPVGLNFLEEKKETGPPALVWFKLLVTVNSRDVSHQSIKVKTGDVVKHVQVSGCGLHPSHVVTFIL